MEKDAENMVKFQGKKKQANEMNETRGAVFYNPVQQFNRDVSIHAINNFGEMLKAEKQAKGHPFDGLYICEALGATGLRSVRYVNECKDLKKLVTNDIDPVATELMRKNMEFNKCDPSKYHSKYLSTYLTPVLPSS
jgi:tRNA (guanine26-N2/guanine27-N2)-dimethyltransferase